LGGGGTGWWDAWEMWGAWDRWEITFRSENLKGKTKAYLGI
jgi:hypothetical protein